LFGGRWLARFFTRRTGQIRAGAERYAVNFPIQGTAADILKRAMIDVHDGLVASRTGARMILTVHDELLFEAPAEAADETTAIVRRLMEGAVTLNVPLTVDVGAGANWKEAKS
jgi:DNA polymerase-1